MVRRLIINADDYGLCAEVNAAVEELIDAGRLRDVSVLANGILWESSVRFLQNHPQISAGIHLNAVEGRPISSAPEIRLLTDANGRFVGLRGLMARWVRHPLAVGRAIEIEWRAQLDRLRNIGLHLSHADSHQHLHAFPPAWRCAVKLCAEYGIAALRVPMERNALPLRRAESLALGASLNVARLATGNKKLQHNDQFLGFKRAGAYGIAELIDDLRNLPSGLTEVGLHPSAADGVPYANLFGNRERQALLDRSLPLWLADLEIELTTWETSHHEAS